MNKSNCDFICSKCPIYKATQENNINELNKILEKLQKETKKDLNIDSILCDGCTENKRLFYYCYECDLRNGKGYYAQS